MDSEQKRKQSFLLRLPSSIREQAILLAHEDGTSLNHFITIAVAEKLSRMGQRTVPKPNSPAGSMVRTHIQLH